MLVLYAGLYQAMHLKFRCAALALLGCVCTVLYLPHADLHLHLHLHLHLYLPYLRRAACTCPNLPCVQRACLQCPGSCPGICSAPALPASPVLHFPCQFPLPFACVIWINWNLMEPRNQNDKMGPRLPCQCLVPPCRISISNVSYHHHWLDSFSFADRCRALPSLALDRSPRRHRTKGWSEIHSVLLAGCQAGMPPLGIFTAEGFTRLNFGEAAQTPVPKVQRTNDRFLRKFSVACIFVSSLTGATCPALCVLSFTHTLSLVQTSLVFSPLDVYRILHPVVTLVIITLGLM